MKITRSPREIWQYSAQFLNRLMVGGVWGLSLPPQIQRNLRWFLFDGMFAAASDNLYGTYAVVYILALGATRSQIGLMSSLASLVAALMLLPGAMLVERIGHRREIVLGSVGTFARSMILMLAISPLLWAEPGLALIAIGFAVTRDAFANLSYPAWASMAGAIVPAEGRGRYLSSRFMVQGFASIATTIVMGGIITRMVEPVGYQIAMLAAFVLGMCATLCYSRINEPDPAPPRTANKLSIGGLLSMLRDQPAFVTLCGTLFVWNFALNVAGPFFTVYHVRELNASAAMVGMASVALSLTSMLAQRRWGVLTDRWGARRVQLIGMLTIPVLPLLWTFTTQAWHVILINLVSGVLWSGYNLAAFSFMLHITPDAERARLSAIYQMVVTLALAAGAATGSFVISQVGYHGVFNISAAGRMLAALLFAWLLRHHHTDHADDHHD